jgi:exodeoxyribonuclease VII small subunit
MSDERESGPGRASAAPGSRGDRQGAVPATGSGAGIESLTFDEAFEALEQAVAELEAGGQPLEVTLALYERAVALQRHCEHLLGQAEIRVRQLIARPGGVPAAMEVSPEEASEETGPGG